jgi:DNA-binding response OmpR family regulator
VARKVLIVDDEPNIVESLEFLMRSGGFEVRSARNGDDALQVAAEFNPDVLLLDVMLPGRSGFEVCRQIRADPRLQEIRIVMLTARGRAAEQDAGLALGADAYVVKPFSTREVLRTVRELMA